MQYGFYVNQTRCTGCFTCIVACRDWHDVPAGPASWIRVKTIEKGKYPDLFVAFLPVMCYHCQQPACIPACPPGAITKRDEDGIVVVDRDTCLGADCQLCLEACPYDAPQFGAKKPVCVDSCPTWALDAGPLDELREKYGDVKNAEGFVYSTDLAPSVTFKPKQNAKGIVN